MLEPARIKKYRKKHKLAGSLLIKNPVLVMGLDLPFLIVTSVSLRAATAISLELLLIHMGTVTAAMILCRYIPKWARPLVYVAVSTLIMAFTRVWLMRLFRGVTDTLGMYIYLMAVNGMTFYQAMKVEKEDKIFPVLSGALVNVVGFTLAMFLTSLLREYAGNGTLWGVPIPSPMRLNGILMPFFGFILIGFLLAGARFFNKKLLVFSLTEQARQEERFKVVDDAEPPRPRRTL